MDQRKRYGDKRIQDSLNAPFIFKLPIEFPYTNIEGKELERVDRAKLVGVILQNDLKWDAQVEYITTKAKQKLYFLVQLRKAGLDINDRLCFYTSIVRSNLEYAVPVFSTSLPTYLRQHIECIQKRALSIIFLGLTYDEAL